MINRVIIVGHFGRGNINAQKRSAWIASVTHNLPSAEIVILERDFVDPTDQNGKSKIIYAPGNLHSAPISLRRVLKGTLNFAKLVFSKPDLGLEILALEILMITGRSHRLAYPARALSLLCGISYVIDAVELTKFRDGDIVVLWAEHSAGAKLIKRAVAESGATLVWSEYGELPGTFMVSEYGMFHESWPALNRVKFSKLPISNTDLCTARLLLNNIKVNRRSNKVYSKQLQKHDLNAHGFKQIIYLNLGEPFMSGFQPGYTRFSKNFSPWHRSNKSIERAMASFAARTHSLLLIKYHPNVEMYMPIEVMQSNKSYNHVRYLRGEEIHSVIAGSDVVVSLGSKTVFLALAQGVPVVLLGPYTISDKDLAFGIEYGRDLDQAINRALQRPRGERVDRVGYETFAARLLKYYLYSFDANGSPWGRNPDKMIADLNAWRQGRKSTIIDSDPLLSFKHMTSGATFVQGDN